MVGVSATEGFGPRARPQRRSSPPRRWRCRTSPRLCIVAGAPIRCFTLVLYGRGGSRAHPRADQRDRRGASLASLQHDRRRSGAAAGRGGLTHEPAARLAQLLIDITPSGLATVFFCDSGSVSVKMALQYWRSRGHLMSGMSGNIPAAGTGETMTRPHPNWGVWRIRKRSNLVLVLA